MLTLIEYYAILNNYNPISFKNEGESVSGINNGCILEPVSYEFSHFFFSETV